MKASCLGLVAAAALVAAPASQATVNSTISISVTTIVQESYEVDGDKEIGRVTRTRISSITVSRLIEDELGMSLPFGSRVIIGTNQDSWVEDRQGNFLYDTSSYIYAYYDFGNSAFDGCYFPETDQERSIIYFPMTLYMNFPTASLFLTLQGLATERFNATPPSRYNGRQVFSGNIWANTYGMGSFVSGATLAEGRVTLNGREIVTDEIDE